jgi:cytochrome c oxidase subunit 2
MWVAAMGLIGCNEVQSALHPVGPQAGRLDTLWWISFDISAVVFVLVLLALLYGAFHRRQAWREDGAEARAPGDVPTPEPGPEPRTIAVVATAAGITVIILVLWLVFSVTTGRAYTRIPSDDPLVIEVVGHQWWWEVHYPDSAPSRRVVTANEIHVPIRTPVLLQLSASDVIHSFWAPSLAGKRDLIPGHTTSMWFQADTAGIYRGQCAEFCGLEHAKMAFLIVAEPADRFEAWLDRQRAPAPQPTDSLARRGETVFLEGPCALCHTIQGTPANGQQAPDLTHLASRRTIAAGTLPNTRGNLAGWILDPQRIKPGVNMPANAIGSQDLQALLAYLQSLQ